METVSSRSEEQSRPQPVSQTPGICIARLGLLIAIIPALVLLVLPIVVLAARGIGTQGWRTMPDAAIGDAIYLSLVTTAVTVIVTLLTGTPLAYVLARWNFAGNRLLNTIVTLPIVLPPAVAGLALLLTFGRRGLLGQPLDALGISIPFTATAVIMAQVFVAAPFYIRAAQVGFRSIAPEVEDAARVDGANGWVLFRYIILPLSGRALIAGLILAWARAIGEFGATIMFAGSLQGRTQTMPLLVYNIFERDIDAAIWTGLLLVAVALIALIISQLLVPRENF